ncbi:MULTISPECIES: DUF305 domain-containing protein [Streptosporangium]|uniref:Uncharacterized protein (DUF305 family) n=1 Tax=Streptosporangium brasiliense TaxID=47480 RepID=A0ABT9R943_9ACTN|nr:DUF305 domain-containing protein [Streptosporangium brasiliense]MDP9865658.1 uncharacterized protein (DUF305 family) [Streptosporangium brasiliense]
MKRTALAALAVLGGLLLAGCGAHSIQELRGDASAGHGGAHAGHGAARTPGGTAVAGKDFNPADVMFLQMMTAHNGQGVELVRLAPVRTTRQEVRTLAAAIATTQEVEAASMAEQLIDWGRPIGAEPGEHAAHGGMPGVSKAEIAAVAGAAPADFEKKFLNMLIAQQDDAVQMARMEVSTGLNAEVKALAARIDASRTAQIKQILALLGQ